MTPSAPIRLLALLFALAAPVARAETVECQVLSALPANINAPGHYCLHANFDQAFDFWAINITVDDVVLDCNDHRLRNTNPAIGYPGISIGDNRRRITVRNCTVEGFHDGIGFNNATGLALEDNTLLRFRQHGIIGSGTDVRIEGNRMADGLGNENGGIVGVYFYSFDGNGAGSVIRGNTIADFNPPAAGPVNDVIGIFVANARNTVIDGNTIFSLRARADRCVWGVYGSGASGTSVTNNTVLGALAPYEGYQCGGVSLFGTAEEQASNACRDNVVGHFNGNISGCLEIGNTEL